MSSWSPTSCHPISLLVLLLASLPSSSLLVSFLISKCQPVSRPLCPSIFAVPESLQSVSFGVLCELTIPSVPPERHPGVPCGHLPQEEGETGPSSSFQGPP